MILLSLLSAVALVGSEPQNESPQPAPPAPAAAWSDLPEAIQAEIRNHPAFKRPHSVVRVEGAATDVRPEGRVDHGDLLFLQAVSPEGGVRLRAAPDGKAKYGAAGRELWRVEDAGADWWCGRNLAKFKANVFAGTQPNIYCLRDADADGRFEIMYENDQTPLGYPTSAFLVDRLGDDEHLKTPAPYERVAASGTPREVLALRYRGPIEARIDRDRLVDGLVELELLIGPERANLDTVRRLFIRTNPQGEGRIDLPNGLALAVSDVRLDGTAHVRLNSALTPGPVKLTEIEPATLLELLQREASAVEDLARREPAGPAEAVAVQGPENAASIP